MTGLPLAALLIAGVLAGWFVIERVRWLRERRGFVGFVVVVVVGAGGMIHVQHIAEDGQDTAERVEQEASRTAQLTAATGALFCTGGNRGDRVDAVLLRGAKPRDAAAAAKFAKLAEKIPTSQDCGELVCQLLAGVADESDEIEIRDPFGPDRPRSPCEPPAPPAAAGATAPPAGVVVLPFFTR